MYFFALLLLPKLLYSLELNLMCTNDNINNKEVDVKDIFLLLDSDSKKLNLVDCPFLLIKFLSQTQMFPGQQVM